MHISGFYLYDLLGKANYTDQKWINDRQDSGKKKKRLTLKGLEGTFWDIGKILYLGCGIINEHIQYPKTHQIHHLKQITILGCDFRPQ